VFRCFGARRCESSRDFEARSFAGRNRTNGRNTSADDEDTARETGLDGRNDQAAACVAQPLEAAQGSDDPLERGDAVAQTGCVLVAPTLGEVTKASVQARQRQFGTVELFFAGAVECTACQPCTRAAADRAEWCRCLRTDELVATASQIHITIGPGVPRVGHWAELP